MGTQGQYIQDVSAVAHAQYTAINVSVATWSYFGNTVCSDPGLSHRNYWNILGVFTVN
jgi:hypothetical protein